MSMFQNPEFLNLARQFLATPSKGGSDKFPNMEGFSKTPYGRTLLTSLMGRMPQRKSAAPKGQKK